MNADRSVAVLAHGLGGSADLPIPFTYALIGAAWALTFTFAVVALAWRKPRFDPDKPGRELPPWVTAAVDAPLTRWVVGIVGLLLTVWVGLVAFLGPQDADNPLPGVFYVLMWVGLVAVSLVLGPVWRVLSPVRTVHRLLGGKSLRAYPDALGYWPAALGLFAFVWLELASPDPGSLAAIRIWLLIYLAVTLAGALVCGARWCARADPFEVYGMVVVTVVGAAAQPRRPHRDRQPVRPSALPAGAAGHRRGALGAAGIDGVRQLLRTAAMAHVHRRDRGIRSDRDADQHRRSAGLRRRGRGHVLAGREGNRQESTANNVARLPGQMAHSLIPIVVGYVFAHYLTYLIERGQQTIFLLFGMDADVNYFLSLHPSVLATIKVGCVVGGHVAGVIAAHDRALRLLPKAHQLTGQLAMMLVMVGYTFTGLYLLFGG